MSTSVSYELLAKIETAVQARAKRLDLTARMAWRIKLDERSDAALKASLLADDRSTKDHLFRISTILDVAWSATGPIYGQGT